MKNMSFLKTPEEIQYFEDLGKNHVQFRDQEGIFVAWETKPEIINKLVPAPMEPVGPFVFAYICTFYETNFSRGYSEGGLFIPVKCDGKIMSYCLAMPIAGNNDLPIAGGREMLGFPKKSAEDMRIVRQGNYVKAYIERHGVKYIELEAEIGEYNNQMATNILGDAKAGDVVDFNFLNFTYNYKLGTKMEIVDVKLVNTESKIKYQTFEKANAKITLNPSLDDPWAELEVVQVLGAAYCRFGLDMHSAPVVAELDADTIKPYLFARWDASMVGHKFRDLK